MSREQYRARGKQLQKLGRDGLVEQDKATGEERRVSQRAADISFGPDRSPEQAVQRTPAQGKKRRQRPRPTVTEEVQTNAPDVSNMAEPPPAVRGAGDTPMPAPPRSTGNVTDRPKKRRRRKQSEKLRQDAAPLPAEDTPEGRRLKFEDNRPPVLEHPTGQDCPQLRFEGEAVPRTSEKNGTAGIPPPTRRRTRSAEDTPEGGRLKLEGDHPPAPEHSTGQDRPRLRFEGEAVSQTPETDGTPDAPPPTHRQQKWYEKAERRVEQSGRRLEKAQAKLPARRRARLEKEYDANSGKVRHRLRFETEVEPEAVKPLLPAQVGHTMKTAAVMKLHGKMRENERDNVALEAAQKTEFAAEQGAGRLLRWNKRRLRSKPYRAVRLAERRLLTDQGRLAWQTALRNNPELRRKNILAKWIQKQKIKRKYSGTQTAPCPC